jgi:hypothetical protein
MQDVPEMGMAELQERLSTAAAGSICLLDVSASGGQEGCACCSYTQMHGQ